MNRGAMAWFRMFGATIWNLLIIKPYFIEFFEKPRLKSILEIGGILGINQKKRKIVEDFHLHLKILLQMNIF
jgi:hypothetical protein